MSLRNDLLKSLGPIQHAESRSQDIARKYELMLRAILHLILTVIQQSYGMSQVMVAINDAIVPEHFDAYKKSNALGTKLGQGVGGEGGFRMFRTGTGNVIRCYQNAAICIDGMTDEDLQHIADELGVDAAGLMKQIEALPKV